MFFGSFDKLLFITIPLAFAFWAAAESSVSPPFGERFRPAAVPLRVLSGHPGGGGPNPYTLISYARPGRALHPGERDPGGGLDR